MPVLGGGCGIVWYQAAQAEIILELYQVVFMGDSVMRQIFLRLVWFLRGFEEVVEHYFHSNAIYVQNATHDVFYISNENLPRDTIFSMPLL